MGSFNADRRRYLRRCWLQGVTIMGLNKTLLAQIIASMGVDEATQAVAYLQSLGANAHVWLPGVGTLNGLTAGNWLDSAGTTPATVDNPVGKVSDAIGSIAATQPTTANKPQLKLSGGKYFWLFDGSNDSLALSAPSFDMTDSWCVVGGLKAASLTTRAWCVASGSAAIVGGVSLEAGKLSARFLGDGYYPNTTISDAGSTAIGEAIVVTTLCRSTAFSLRKNGVVVGSGTVPSKTNVLTGGTIGGFDGAHFNGSLYPTIAIKGTVPDDKLKLLERLVANLSGVTL